MATQYQIVSIGSVNPLSDKVNGSILDHIIELGMSVSAINFIDESNFTNEYKANSPAICLYYGEKGSVKNQDILSRLIPNGCIVVPIVSEIGEFTASIPMELRKINGFQLTTEADVEKIASVVLEGLGLLRLSRRLFISYKRSESSNVAIQLFERFEKNGFDVFLDTHSIRPGEPFQDELWHRMADTDIVVLLNTPGFLNSEWTTKELAQANAMSIGILQVIWPTHKLERDAELSIPFQLSDSDFGNMVYNNSKAYLIDSVIENIISEAESLRARSLAARHDNIITEFLSSANRAGIKFNLHPEKFITIEKKIGEELVIIPTVGVPQSFTYNQSEELVQRIKSNAYGIYLLYDHRHIRDRWLNHLAWLDNYLPVKALKIVDVEKWLKKS